MTKPDEGLIKRLQDAEKEFSAGKHMFEWQQQASLLIRDAISEIKRLSEPHNGD